MTPEAEGPQEDRILDNKEEEWPGSGNYTYMLLCADHTLYTGWTNDLKKRLLAHNSGRGAKYTRTRRPVRLVYWESFATKQEAMAREYAIKQLTRKQKEDLVRQWKISHQDK